MSLHVTESFLPCPWRLHSHRGRAEGVQPRFSHRMTRCATESSHPHPRHLWLRHGQAGDVRLRHLMLDVMVWSSRWFVRQCLRHVEAITSLSPRDRYMMRMPHTAEFRL